MPDMKRWITIGLLFTGMLFGPKMLYAIVDMVQQVRQDPNGVALAIVWAPIVVTFIACPLWALVSGRNTDPVLCLIASGWSMFVSVGIVVGAEHGWPKWRALLWLFWSLYFFLAYRRDRFDYEHYTKTYD